MRIGLLTDGFTPAVNGIVRFIFLLKAFLESAGHEVTVFTWGSREEAGEDGVVRSLGLPFIKPGYRIGWGYSLSARRSLQTMDILHAQQPVLSGLLAVRYGRRHRIPIVLTCHSRYDLIGMARVHGIIPLPLYRAVLRPCFRWVTDRCSLVAVPSQGAAQVMRGLGVAGPLHMIPFGICRPPEESPKPRPSREKWGLPQNAPVAIYVGRLDGEKNVRFLLEALALPGLQDCFLVIVGDGPERNRLAAAAEQLGVRARIRFTGEVGFQDVPSLLALADFFVTASQVEMAPLAVLEAYAAGLPVLAPDVPWARDFVQPGINGFLSPPGVSSFARLWASLNTDLSLRSRLSANALETSAQYDFQRTGAKYLEVYQELARPAVRAEKDLCS